MDDLLERDVELAALGSVLSEARGAGRVALVIGESGIGKSRLVRRAAQESGLPVLWGACDPLSTPRPLGPLRDIARTTGGALAEALAGTGGREAALGALLDALDRPPSIVVVEDIHWVDEATLDLLGLIGRRIGRQRGALILTAWPEALGSRDDVRRGLAAVPHETLRTIEPAPLSVEAVCALAAGRGRDGAALHRSTGGNPFFVTEALASPGEEVPTTVRAAVAARHAGLPTCAREVLDLVSVFPGPTPITLIDRLASDPSSGVDACLAAAVIVERGPDAIGFRHELACQANARGIGVLRRRGLEARVLGALEADGDAEPARLAHHALGTGDAAAIRRHAPAAARAAAAAAGHREALEHWKVALEAGGGRDALEGVAQEAYLCGDSGRALEARRRLLALDEATGDQLRLGTSLHQLSRALWWDGRGAEAVVAADRAIAVLDRLVPGQELARALSARSQLAMLSDQLEVAVALGDRAGQLARDLGDVETLAHALTNVGTALIGEPDRDAAGREMLEEAHRLAVADASEDHAARALVNLAVVTLERSPDHPAGPRDLERALTFVRAHELDGYAQYLHGVRAGVRLTRGDPEGARQDADLADALGAHLSGVAGSPALIAHGRLQTWHGDPRAARTLERAWEQAVATGEVQRLAPAAAARAEHAWLEGDLPAVTAAVSGTYPLALDRGHRRYAGELALWLRRAGTLQAPPGDVPEPYASALTGDSIGAAERWRALGRPYDAALALWDAGFEDALLEALATFDRLGATGPALRLRRHLRAQGVRRVPRGPRAASRAAPSGLTPRQMEVLALLGDGTTNAEIAARLVVSEKTVDHHVSAVLAKLGAPNRRVAAAMYREILVQDGESVPMSAGHGPA